MGRRKRKWVSYCIEDRKMRMKRARKPLPDLNYPPPLQQSESSPPHNHYKVLSVHLLIIITFYCSCWKKRVKYERKPLPDLNYPPPPPQESESSSSSSSPHNNHKLLEIAHEPTAATSASSSRKPKMRESESNFDWFKACCKTLINDIMTIFNNNKNKDDSAQSLQPSL